ncbi:MAG: energy-coupling factor transporter transmembrane protein EcfT [bacterium]|nr:energy-coupling factor transporter transmembrane protein EcfT [bacterium]
MQIPIGQYIFRPSLIHHLNPVLKLGYVIVLLAGILLSQDLHQLGLIGLFLLGITGLSRLTLRIVLGGLKTLRWLLLFSFLIQLLMNGEGTAVFSLGSLVITYQALEKAIFFTSRLALLILTASLLTLTTSPLDLTHALTRVLFPLKIFKVPVEEIGLMIVIALRFFPILARETETILRNADSGMRNAECAPTLWVPGISDFRLRIAERLKKAIPLLVSVIADAFHKADELAVTLESRSAAGKISEDQPEPKALKAADYGAMVLLLLVIVGILVL